MRIVIEPEGPSNSRVLFRLLVGEKPVAEAMTAAQLHILVGDILEQMTLQKKPGEIGAATLAASRPAIGDEAALHDLPKIADEPYDGSPVA